MRLKFFVSLLALTLLATAQRGEEPAAKPAIELGAPFCDNAVLQREMLVPVWGWSKPGATVIVEFARQKKSATAGADGKWLVKLDPLKASDQPAEMTISENTGKKVVLKNILVGEVWMASGQSNMQWLAGKCDVAALLARVAERVKAGKEKEPVIREFGVNSVFSALHPIEHATGAWSTNSLSTFSAVATAFAYELYRELGVPIGILNCSFSQTSIQTWTPRNGFRDGKDEYTQAIYKKILITDPTTPEHKAAWDKFYQEQEETLAKNEERKKNGQPCEPISTAVPGNFADRDASWMFNGRMNPVIPYAIRGAIWNQGYANMGEGYVYYHNLHSLIRGWRELWGREFPVYFHQFYAPGANDGLSLNSTCEMRLGAWQARDIPEVGMACQIDITGVVHYTDKALPGKRLALHALKNQYGKKIVSDGPMFKDYEVKGDKLIVSFDFAEGGLQVGKTTMGKTLDGPTVIENDEDKVTLFYLAGNDRVWHRAKLKIDGEKVVLTTPGVAEPHGVAYACNGVGELPNLYNRAMLPLAPFIFFDHKLVLSSNWPDSPVKVEGVKPDLSATGERWEYRKMPLLAAMFRDNAVLQAGKPVVIWGAAVHPYLPEPKGKVEIKFSFMGVEKTIPVTPGMKEWRVTIPPQEASAEPKTLKVTCMIDGELVHERVCTNIVFGDVWYIANGGGGQGPGGNGAVRAITCRSKEKTSETPRRYSVSVSMLHTPDNRFGSLWQDAEGGLAEALGRRIHEKTGKPVGFVSMDGSGLELKHWMAPESLKDAPGLEADYRQLMSLQPGNEYYDANVRSYLAAWRKYWDETIPRLMESKRLAEKPGYPVLGASVTTDASQGYNIRVHCFWPASFKGILFLCDKSMVEKDQGALFGGQLAALANGWKAKFALRSDSGQGCEDPCFIYTIPSVALAPKITKPTGIKGQSVAVEITQWPVGKVKASKDDAAAVQKQMEELIEQAMREIYR